MILERSSLDIRIAFKIINKVKVFSEINNVLAKRQNERYGSTYITRINKIYLEFDENDNVMKTYYKDDCIWSDTYPDFEGRARPESSEVLPVNSGAFPEFDLRSIEKGATVLLCGESSSRIGKVHHERTMVEIVKTMNPESVCVYQSEDFYSHYKQDWRIHGIQSGSCNNEMMLFNVLSDDKKVADFITNKDKDTTVLAFECLPRSSAWAKNADYVFVKGRSVKAWYSSMLHQAFDSVEDIRRALYDNGRYRCLVLGPAVDNKRPVYEYCYNWKLAELRRGYTYT